MMLSVYNLKPLVCASLNDLDVLGLVAMNVGGASFAKLPSVHAAGAAARLVLFSLQII